MRIRELISQAQKALVQKGLSPSEAEREVLLLLGHLLGLRPLEVYFYEGELSEVERPFWELLSRRKKGVPLAYLLGEVEFFGRPFVVASGVLIPRPETEILVEAVLERLSPPGWVLELGVGSGCVALTLAAEGGFKILGIEISRKALEIAQKNRLRMGLGAQVFWVQGDWCAPLRPGPHFKAVVSNPPYISEEEWASLPEEVKDYEPREALWGGEKGLDFIVQTLREAPRYLCPGGYVFLELGYQQQEEAARWARALGYRVEFVKDLLGHARVLVASFP